MKTHIITIFLLITSLSLLAEESKLTQTIKGRVIDKASQAPLPGANIVLLDSDPIRGVQSNVDGYFVLENVPVGRQGIHISYIGYEPLVFPNLNVSSGKELYIEAELEEKVTSLKGVEITASDEKSKPLNSMATLSARTFSIEESQRFAGARNDVARMASNFAGVATANDANNDIVIRGNSPNGLLWRLEGIEIPNPNHFGFMGSTGGPVNMLNNNTLSTSDFYTAAFPAEYGNALSGVFDLRMREGNTDKHEFLGQMGFNGFELGAEGPLSKNKRSSYLVNYRYSTLGVFQALGINFGTGTALPEYQDLSFKMSWQTGSKGRIELFGLGGISSIDIISSDKDGKETDDNFYDWNSIDIYNDNRMGVVGLKHFHRFNDKTWSNITIAATHVTNQEKIDSLRKSGSITRLQENKFRSNNFIANFQLNRKVSSRLNYRLGLNHRIIDFDLNNDTWYDKYNAFFPVYDEEDVTSLTELYAQAKYRPSDQFTFNVGIHSQRLGFQDEFTLEPRLGLTYELREGRSINLGYGMHAQMQNLSLYFNRIDISADQWLQPNLDLEQTKAHHLVLGYDHNFNSTLRLKAEVYYQSIFDAVVNAQPGSYSTLNSSAMNFVLPEALTNEGTGENYGLDVTFEKFMDRGFYYLATASIFRSRYTASDNITRSTAFDGNYVATLLGGKEWALNSKKDDKQHWISLDTRIAAAGGQRYTPVDIEESILEGETVYDTENAFSKQFDDYFRWDVRIAYRVDRAKFSHEWAVDVQNVTNKENALYMIYDTDAQSEKVVNQLKIFPVMQYRITF